MSVITSASRTVPSYYKYLAVILGFFIMLVIYSVFFSFGVFFKPVLEEFGWSRAVTSGAFSFSWISQGIMSIFTGWLCDKIGPRIVISTAGILIGGGLLLTSQIQSAWQYYVYYGLIIGVGLSGVVVPLLSTVARWFEAKRSVMTSIVASGVGVGVIIGPPVINILVEARGWRESFMILGTVIVVAVVLAAQWLRIPARKQAADGSAAIPETQEQNKAIRQYTLPEAARTAQFWLVVVIFITLAYSVYTLMVHLVPHITDIGFSGEAAASVMSVLGIINVCGTLFLGGAADRIGVKWVYAFGLLFTALAYFGFAFAQNLPLIYVFAALFGLATGGCCATQSIVVANLFGTRCHGVIFGVMNAGFAAAAAGAPLLAGFIFDVRGSYYLAFILAGAMGCLGLALNFLTRPQR